MSSNDSTLPNLGSCEGRCSTHYIPSHQLPEGETCECYYNCAVYEDCCDDFYTYCDGMGAIEQAEKEALAEVAAFSVFYSIILFVLVLVLLSWAFYTLYQHFKKHGFGASFSAHDSSGFILQDTRLMIIISYIGMSLYLLSLFCYLIANGSLGVDYNPNNDTYGNSQIAAIIFWFLGHSLFYLLFILKLHNFIMKTTYSMDKRIQFTAYGVLFCLYLVSIIVTCIWIDEFHNHYHYGAINDEKIIACMVIAFASHLWFCLSLILFFSIVLYKVVSTKTTTLIRDSSDGHGGDSRSRKSELEDEIIEYMTRVSVLVITALSVTIFCMLMWIILMGLDVAGHGFVRFCWWLFPFNVLMCFMSLFLGLNFHPNMNDIYKKICICPHAFCKHYCVKASIGKNAKRGTAVRDYDDDDDDDEDDDRLKMRDNDDEEEESDNDNEKDDYRAKRERDRDDDEDEDESDSDERHGFAMNTSDQTAFTKVGE